MHKTSGTSPDLATGSSPARLMATVGLVLSLLVYLSFSTSGALYTDSETVGANTLSTGTLDLVDDDTGSAMFSVTGIYPGQTVERCIVVTQQGTIANPGPVRLYRGASGYTDTTGGTLAANLLLDIDEGTGSSFAAGDCTGFSSLATIVSGVSIDTFDTTFTGYGSGAGTWDPATTPESRTYRIQVTLDSAAPNSVQAGSVGFGFVWETQS